MKTSRLNLEPIHNPSADGYGNRVLQENPGGTTTLFLGSGAYEVHLSAGGQETLVRRYYSLGGQRVLLDGTDTYYLLTDHSGSVVAVADSEGDLALEPDWLKHISCTKNIKQRPKIIPFRPRNIFC